MADESPKPPRPEPPLVAAIAAARLGKDMNTAAASILPIITSPPFAAFTEAVRHQQAIASVFANGQTLKVMKDLVDSPTLKVLSSLTAGPSTTLIGESIARLAALPRFPVPIPERPYTPPVPGPSPAVMTVSAIHELHEEVEAVVVVLNESTRQTTAMVEITTASLTALQAVVAELHKSRRAGTVSNAVLILLTLALLATAPTVIPALGHELSALWGWLQTLHG